MKLFLIFFFPPFFLTCQIKYCFNADVGIQTQYYKIDNSLYNSKKPTINTTNLNIGLLIKTNKFIDYRISVSRYRMYELVRLGDWNILYSNSHFYNLNFLISKALISIKKYSLTAEIGSGFSKNIESPGSSIFEGFVEIQDTLYTIQGSTQQKFFYFTGNVSLLNSFQFNDKFGMNFSICHVFGLSNILNAQYFYQNTISSKTTEVSFNSNGSFSAIRLGLYYRIGSKEDLRLNERI
jgi:hypothetical protein